MSAKHLHGPAPLDHDVACSGAFSPFGTSFALPVRSPHVTGGPCLGTRTLLRSVVGLSGSGRPPPADRKDRRSTGDGCSLAAIRLASSSSSSSATCGNTSRPTRRNGWSSPRRHAYEVPCQLEVIQANYQECYHCSEIQPDSAGSPTGQRLTRSNHPGCTSPDPWTCSTASRRCRWTGSPNGVPLQGPRRCTNCGRWATFGSSRTC